MYRNVWIKTEPTEFNVQNYSTEILYLLLSLSTNSFSFLWGTKLWKCYQFACVYKIIIVIMIIINFHTCAQRGNKVPNGYKIKSHSHERIDLFIWTKAPYQKGRWQLFPYNFMAFVLTNMPNKKGYIFLKGYTLLL